jgi:hypothetical protein
MDRANKRLNFEQTQKTAQKLGGLHGESAAHFPAVLKFNAFFSNNFHRVNCIQSPQTAQSALGIAAVSKAEGAILAGAGYSREKGLGSTRTQPPNPVCRFRAARTDMHASYI